MVIFNFGRREQIIIELKNIFYAYDENFVLRDVNLRVEKGETVALCGANGAGKSTLLKIINGLIFPVRGVYEFEGVEINEKILSSSKFSKNFHQKIGFVWQNSDVQLFCSSVEEEISFGPEQMGLPESEIKKRLEDALEFFGLKNLRHRAPYTLSGGEKKKTALASVLTMNPAVWTLDEPLSALDEKTKEILTNFLLELKKAGKTIIFSSHDSNFIKKIADTQLNLQNDNILTPKRAGEQ